MESMSIACDREELIRRLSCPITLQCMRDPVIADDDVTYERNAIAAWYKVCKRKHEPLSSPLTKKHLNSSTLRPNLALKSMIDFLTGPLNLELSTEEPTVTMINDEMSVDSSGLSDSDEEEDESVEENSDDHDEFDSDQSEADFQLEIPPPQNNHSLFNPFNFPIVDIFNHPNSFVVGSDVNRLESDSSSDDEEEENENSSCSDSDSSTDSSQEGDEDDEEEVEQHAVQPSDYLHSNTPALIPAINTTVPSAGRLFDASNIFRRMLSSSSNNNNNNNMQINNVILPSSSSSQQQNDNDSESDFSTSDQSNEDDGNEASNDGNDLVISEEDILQVMELNQVSRERAIAAIQAHDGHIVDAILHLAR